MRHWVVQKSDEVRKQANQVQENPCLAWEYGMEGKFIRKELSTILRLTLYHPEIK